MNTPPNIDVIPPAPPHNKTLAEQKSDFTSEGAPAAAPAVTKPLPVDSANESQPKEDPAQSKDLEREQDA